MTTTSRAMAGPLWVVAGTANSVTECPLELTPERAVMFVVPDGGVSHNARNFVAAIE
ncbi:hypothetical protein MMCCUG48898_4459 [Mycobacteroides abscessus subsp. massiliense CCUG 48898 = JCM 15300]|nr:hypothetical protein MMCCUG48898_4459 [Mycobacteroides abscessus subsp. massiliense CCUG 48898 = JCM 15300]